MIRYLLPLAVLLPLAARALAADEMLSLRAGWLWWSSFDTRPPFAMPWAVAVGALAHLVPDPRDLWTLLRVATVTALVASWTWAAERPARMWAAALLSPLVVVHGPEMRYDAAILVGLGVGLGAIRRRMDLVAGMACAFVALHHGRGAVIGLAMGLAWAVDYRGRR